MAPVLVDHPYVWCNLQVDFDQLRRRIGSCIYCASICNTAARETVQATLEQCCNVEVAAHPAQTLPGGFSLPTGSTREAVLQHIEQLPAHPPPQGAAHAGAKQRIATAASEALIAALRQCRL